VPIVEEDAKGDYEKTMLVLLMLFKEG